MDFSYLEDNSNNQWDIGDPNHTFVKSDGTSLFVLESTDGYLYEFEMTTPYDLSTVNTTAAASADLKTITSDSIAGHWFTFKEDGSTVIYGNASRAYNIDMSTAWDLSTASLGGTSPDLSGWTTFGPMGGCISPDGAFLYQLCYGSQNRVYQGPMSTPWDVTTLTVGTTEIVAADMDLWPAACYDMCFIDDGTVALISDKGATLIDESVFSYLCKTPGDLTTAVAMRNNFPIYSKAFNWGGPLIGVQEIMASGTRYMFAYDEGNNQQVRFDYTPTFSDFEGVVREDTTAVSRLVALYHRDTGRLFQNAVSNASTGAFSFDCLIDTEDHFIIAFDDAAGTDYNAVIYDKVVGV